MAGRPIRYARTMYEAAEGADAVALITEWKEFRMPDWPQLHAAMRGDAIIDGPQHLRQAGGRGRRVPLLRNREIVLLPSSFHGLKQPFHHGKKVVSQQVQIVGPIARHTFTVP